jgi:hypothetical protein
LGYNGDHVTFSPDGTCVTSIYGKFLKIWKTNTGYEHQKPPTQFGNEAIGDVYISPDECLVVFKTKERRAQILDATTGLSLFTFAETNIISIEISPNSIFVACLFQERYGSYGVPGIRKLVRWNANTRRLDRDIVVDDDTFRIALSSNGSRFASLSPRRMILWDLESEVCLAILEFVHPLLEEQQVSFAIKGTSVSLENAYGIKSWCISPSRNLNGTSYSIENGTKCWLVAPSYRNTKLPMIFLPITEERSYQSSSAPSQSYSCNRDCEWIMDQDGRRILWIPPDERPQKSWNNSNGRKVVVETESGKVYIVDFSLSEKAGT